MTNKDTVIKALECCGNQTYSCKDKQCRAKALGDAVDFINQQDAEIERLKSMNQAKLDMIHDLREEFEKIKAEAVKEFAENLEIALSDHFGGGFYKCHCRHVIDNLLKERVGEK